FRSVRTFGRAGVGRAALAPTFDAWDRSQYSPNVDEAFASSPSPRGRGRGEGEGFVRFSIASPTLRGTLPIPSKIAKNHFSKDPRLHLPDHLIQPGRRQQRPIFFHTIAPQPTSAPVRCPLTRA